MTQIDFYQVGPAGLNAVLFTLVKKTCAAGKKALILCPQPAASSIDTMLWSFEADAWLPHGLDDAKGDSHALVWISSDMAKNPINADFLFLLHGSEPASWYGFKRCFCLFDGQSEAQLSRARAQWTQWKLFVGVKLGYYSQNTKGGWSKESQNL
jgi:DNA polymerase-3 subunit chi